MEKAYPRLDVLRDYSLDPAFFESLPPEVSQLSLNVSYIVAGHGVSEYAKEVLISDKHQRL